MTGTSLDGLDAALVACEGEGLGLRLVGVLGSASAELPARRTLRELAAGKPVEAGAVARAALELGEAHAAAVARMIERHVRAGRVELVALHGQTVHHRPPASWQLINPWPVVRSAGVPVVFDLRGADLACGGQGAPITPLADWVMFRSDTATRVIVNLGGFANATVLPARAGAEDVRGFDVCACNQLLDAAARIALDAPMDDGGLAALQGNVDGRAAGPLEELLDAQASSRRSLGTRDEALGWLTQWATRLSPLDLLATAARTIGSVVGRRVRSVAGAEAEVFLGGGGARNAALAGAIGTTRPLSELGVEGTDREAVAIAVLGLLAADGCPITLTGVTGRAEPAPVAGAWAFPAGRSPLGAGR